MSSTIRRGIPVRLLLLSTEEGGLEHPFESGNQAHWNLGHTEEGRLEVEGGRVVLASAGPLRPGEERLARLEPLVPERWERIEAGRVIPMHQGRQVIGRAVVLEEASE
jgi:hypothetical protein